MIKTKKDYINEANAWEAKYHANNARYNNNFESFNDKIKDLKEEITWLKSMIEHLTSKDIKKEYSQDGRIKYIEGWKTAGIDSPY